MREVGSNNAAVNNDNGESTSIPAAPSSSPLIPRILSGSIGSIITALAVTPLEVVKIRQQAQIAPTSYRGVKVQPCPAGCGTLVFTGLMECVLPIESTTISRSSSTTSSTTPMPNKAGSGTLATLLSIFRNEGYLGLYKGLSPTLVMSVPNTVLYFTAYDEISMILRRNHVTNFANNNIHGEKKSAIENIEDIEDAKRQPYIPLVAGSTARLLASLVTAPLELIRTRQASNTKAQKGMMEEFRLLLRTNGISSLYVGLAPTLWRDVPFSAIYWLFLERFRNALGDSEELGGWGGSYYRERGVDIPPGIEASHAFVSGAGAGSIAAAFTTPFDVVKTRRQMVGNAEAINSCDHLGLKEYSFWQQNKSVGTFGHMQQIVKQEGISGLWKGNLTRMVKVAPACAIMISCYEFGKRVFGEVF